MGELGFLGFDALFFKALLEAKGLCDAAGSEVYRKDRWRKNNFASVDTGFASCGLFADENLF